MNPSADIGAGRPSGRATVREPEAYSAGYSALEGAAVELIGASAGQMEEVGIIRPMQAWAVEQPKL